jgi:hypothetical protein
MKLLTEVAIPDYPFHIDHHSPILMMGSCFTENIGWLLGKYLFPVCINPFGTTYNPLSVKKGLEALLRKEMYTDVDLDHFNDLWFSFDHYTGFSSPQKEEALEKINFSFKRAKTMLLEASFLILTWGTAWVYSYNATGMVVSNCHKIPSSRFTRFRLTAAEIVEAYESIIQVLFDFNQNLKILLTVSPVRHWKDGAHGNQLSKATLLLAQEELGKLYPDQFFYFPSYEIVMDELRDYRFYDRDMIHITDQASQYIWEKFNEALLSKDAQSIIRELIPLLKIMDHRPLIQKGDTYEELVVQRDKKLNELKERYPLLAWNNLNDI